MKTSTLLLGHPMRVVTLILTPLLMELDLHLVVVMLILVLIESSGDITLQAGDVTIDADDDITLQAGDVTINAGSVDIDADDNINIEGGDIIIETGDDDDAVIEIRAANNIDLVAGEDSTGSATSNGGDINLVALTGPTPGGGNVAVNTDGDFTVDGSTVLP